VLVSLVVSEDIVILCNAA